MDAVRGSHAFLLVALVAIVAGTAGASTLVGETVAAPGTVTIDLKAKRQVIQGFGTSERVWSDPHLSKSSNTTVPDSAQREILAALYRRLGLTRVRNVLDAGVQAGPGQPMDFTGKKGDAHVEFVKEARPFGLKTFFPGPRGLEPWMKQSDPGATVDWAMLMLRHWRQLGVEPALYAPLNEPEVAQDFDPKWLHDVVLMLGRRLRAEGFKTKLVIPDDENPVDAYRRAVAVLSDPDARQYVGALAYHIYNGGGPSDWPAMRRLGDKYGLPVWMTEYWNAAWTGWPDVLGWATTMHELLTLGSVNAVDYIWGFFGDWVTDAGTLVSIHFDNGVYKSWHPTALYWVTGQYSRFVRPGYRRVETSGGGNALVSAYVGGRRLVVVAINTSPRAQPLELRTRGGSLKGPATLVRSSANEQWRALRAPRLGTSGLTSVLPPQSVTTFSLRLKG